MSESKFNPLARNSADRDKGAIDFRGRELKEGDEIILNTGNPIFYRIVAITPVMDPKAPPNLLKVEVAAAIHWHCVRGQINTEFIRVRSAEEAGPMNVTKAQEPPA